MIKYKYILPAAVVRCLIYVTVKYTEHEEKEVGPKVTKPVNEVSAIDLTKKRSYYNLGKYQQQKANKDQKGINGEND